MVQQRYTSNHILIQGCPIHQNHVHVSSMTCFPQTHSFDPFMTLFTARAGSAAYVIIGKMATATQKQRTTRQKQLNHIRTTRNTYSDPSRIQSSIPQNIGNSHECYMTATIGLSKTQSQENWSKNETVCSTQPHSRSTLLHTLQNPGQLQGDVE